MALLAVHACDGALRSCKTSRQATSGHKHHGMCACQAHAVLGAPTARAVTGDDCCPRALTNQHLRPRTCAVRAMCQKRACWCMTNCSAVFSPCALCALAFTKGGTLRWRLSLRCCTQQQGADTVADRCQYWDEM